MTSDEKLHAEMSALSPEARSALSDLSALVAKLTKENTQLREQIGGFMAIGGPSPSSLADAFRSAAKAKFDNSDAQSALDSLTEELRKGDQWGKAAINMLHFASAVIKIV